MTVAKTTTIVGSNRDETYTYNMSANAGKNIDVDGKGGCDTLQLEFTREQWMSPAVQADIARLRFYLLTNFFDCDFTFRAFNLTINDFERGRIFVDGVEISLADNCVTARNDSFALKQDGRISGSVVANDTASDLIRSVSLLSGPAAGTLELRNDGTFTYATGDAFDYLAAGQTAQVSFTYKVVDADGDWDTAVATLTITGVNDAAVIGAPTVSQVVEDKDIASGKLVAKGTLSITDADKGEASFRTAVVPASGTLGTLTLAANGSYTYAVENAAVQYLAAGEAKTETFTVTAFDGTQKAISFTITGTNDAPTITSAAQKGAVIEDAARTTATGTIAFSDVDLSDRHTASFAAATGQGALGAFALTGVSEAANAAAGSVGWSYTIDNAKAQFLAAGETRIETYTVTIADGKGGTLQQAVSVTITGTNDAPTITSGAFTGSAADGSPSPDVTGTIAFADVDLADLHRVSAAPVGSTLGTLTASVTADSKGTGTGGAVTWSYHVDPAAIAFLGAGETKVEHFAVTISDGQGGAVARDVAITLVGSNDAAVIGTPAVTAVVEDEAVNAAGQLTAVGTLSIADADQGQAYFAGVDSAPGNLGTLTLAADGAYTYAVDNTLVQSLGEGVVRSESFTVRAADGTSEQVAFTITGVNDAPVARDDHFTVSETGLATLDVLANDSDVDAGDALALSIVSQPVEGQIVLDPSGYFVFNPGAAFQTLSVGQSAEVGFDYQVWDGHGGNSTAHATILVEGAGRFVSPFQTDTQKALVNHQNVSLSLTGPKQTGTLDGHVDVAIDLGAASVNKKNIFFVVDISGSTSLKFAGTPVGDLNGRDGPNTILDAEIAGLLKLNGKINALGYSPDDVTVTVVPFNSKANPADWVSSKPTPNIQTQTFQLGSGGIDPFLKTLDAGGGTNYEEALQGVIEKLQVLDPTGVEGNIVYFLSDGEPNPVNSFGDEIELLNTKYHALMSAIGVGASVPLQYLDMIDNTGGAERVTSTDQLSAALLGSPLSPNHVVDFDLFVNGVQMADIDLDDLVSGPSGFTFGTDIDHLRALVGQSNTITTSITLDDGRTITSSIDTAGVLPVSTVDFLI
ncbi:VCBS domain-containing protein [Sphingomonas aracearum]|uniref:Tandem-95 repeat protein n=1 Tax=Sphingomonas aracearum TaxID=2283317 RepID=A0A369VZR1_9SPHN|nr:VCBS domain-containing protein [Sphingomonas aracearum]RDE05311.1 tandem-95 repeat protein [Sphingomonas aracearum]